LYSAQKPSARIVLTRQSNDDEYKTPLAKKTKSGYTQHHIWSSQQHSSWQWTRTSTRTCYVNKVIYHYTSNYTTRPEATTHTAGSLFLSVSLFSHSCPLSLPILPR